MGIIKSCFSFVSGTLVGVYVAQNYSVPNIKRLTDAAVFMAKTIEQSYRKPDNKPRDDDRL